mmetsp:Transcript_109402/g.172455  ORF Transcript_109402/g.172455 Transcript_109402/m.172455 type:complete len:574 (+) Transcript_109402:66-1787(+)
MAASGGRPRLSPAEVELRDHLLKAAAAAERVLPPQRLSLQEWVERKLPGELILRVEAGNVVLAPAAPKRSNKDPPPPPPPSKGNAAAAAVSTEAFLNGLPQDSFTPAEDKLREAILAAVAAGPVSKSRVLANKEVSPAARAFLPRTVDLNRWIEARIGAEVTLYEDQAGQEMLRLIGDEAAVEQEDPQQARESARNSFFESLPEGAFKQEEETLRFALFDFLAMWRSKELATLEHAMQNADVAKAQAALLPSEVELREWIEYRIGGEMELKETGNGSLAINLLPPARAVVTERFKAMEAKKKEEAKKKAAANEERARPMSQAARQAFFATLPEDELKQEELKLRQVLLDVVNASQRPISMSEITAKPLVKEASSHLLPPGLPLEDWIEERIGGEVDVRKEQGRAGQAVFLASMSLAPEASLTPPPPRAEEVSPAELERRREAFFNKLPADSFAPAEERLREAILGFLDNWKGTGPPLLSQANEELLPIFQKLGKGATLQEWIDKRIGGEVETREHGSEIAFSLTGEMDNMLSAEAAANKGSGKKRKADGQGGSKGKGKASYSRSRSDDYQKGW